MLEINKNLPLTGPHGRPILIDLFYQKNAQPKPVVIFVHGFKGFKDWGAFNLVAEQFAQAGFFFVKFNFSSNGTTPEEPSDFADLEAFGHNTYSIEMDDLGAVIDWLHSGLDFKVEMDVDKQSLIGHSRGGGITILKAAEDKRVKKIVTWASVGDMSYGWSEEIRRKWKETGVRYVENKRTLQKMPLYFTLCEDYYRNEARLSIPKHAAEIAIPWLAIHGSDDEAVALEQALSLKRLNSHLKLEIIPGGNHAFGARHPWDEAKLPEDLAMVVQHTVKFLS